MLKPSLKTFDGLDFDGLEFEGEPHEMITDSTSDEMTLFSPAELQLRGRRSHLPSEALSTPLRKNPAEN